MRKNVCQSSPSFCRCVSILSSKHARKGKTESKMFLFFIFLVLSPQVTWCGISTQNLKSRGFHSHVLITPSEYSFSNFENNRGINVPKKMVVSKGFRFYLEEPQFPSSMLFGFCLRLAFRSRCENFIGVRQSRALLAVQGTKSLHQRLQLVLLQLKVQLDTVTQAYQVELRNISVYLL